MKKIAYLLTLALALVFVGCKEKSDAEKATEALDKAGEAAKDAAKDAGKAIEKGAEKAKDAVK